MPKKISKYEILEEIAQGGFGVVYRARDPFIKREVAVKTCASTNQEAHKRFFREAEIAGQFDHPNLTLVHDFGVEEDYAFLVQEYLPGEDLLAKIQRREEIDDSTKVDYLLQVAQGMAYAHGKGVIHRDIKPGNVRVLPDGLVKVMDFGIAKLITSGTDLTQKGTAVGTVGYFSPEQLRDETLDPGTDIFSFGVIGYELVTYRSPFQGEDIKGLMKAILGSAPQPIVELEPDCPPGLAELIHRCLQKRRQDRYASFLEIIDELEEVQRALTPAATPVERRAERPEPTAPPAPPREAPLPDPEPAPESEAAANQDPHNDTQPVDPVSSDRPQLFGLDLRLVVGAAAGLGLLVLGLILVILLGRREPEETPPEPIEPVAEVPAPVTTVAPVEGELIVVASPWAEIRRVLDAEGQDVALPAPAHTPVRLSLPLGFYSLILYHPDRAEPAICQVRIEAGTTSQCRSELQAVDVTGYFKETGWWQ